MSIFEWNSKFLWNELVGSKMFAKIRKSEYTSEYTRLEVRADGGWT